MPEDSKPASTQLEGWLYVYKAGMAMSWSSVCQSDVHVLIYTCYSALHRQPCIAFIDQAADQRRLQCDTMAMLSGECDLCHHKEQADDSARGFEVNFCSCALLTEFAKPTPPPMQTRPRITMARFCAVASRMIPTLNEMPASTMQSCKHIHPSGSAGGSA